MLMLRLCRRFMTSNDGATAIEYGLIAALIAVSVIVGAESIGNNLSNLFFGVSNKLSNSVN